MMKSRSQIEADFFENTKNHILEDEKNIDKNAKELLVYYERAVEETNNRIHAIYSKFAKEHQMSVQETQAFITSSEQNVFNKTIGEYMQEISMEGEHSKTKKELDVLSAKARLTREEKLLADIYMDMGKMADVTNQELEKVLKETLKTTFIRSAFDIQNTMGVYYRVSMINDSAIQKLVTHPWAKNNYSKALWGHVDNLNAHVKEVIMDGFIQGKSIDKMVRGLQERTEVCKDAVERLIKTEVKYFANQGELEGYEANGITKYVYMGSKEKGYACNCASLNGVIIDVADAKPLENFPPLHPNCKCAVRAYFEESILDNNKNLVHYNKEKTLSEWKHDYIIKNEEDLVKGLQNELKCDIIKTQSTVFESEQFANKATYSINQRGHISLSLYDDKGRIIKQFHNSNHDQPKYHNFGEFGEHVHDWDYEAYELELAKYKSLKSKKRVKKPTPARKARECTKEEKRIMEKLL